MSDLATALEWIDEEEWLSFTPKSVRDAPTVLSRTGAQGQASALDG